jgi:hypothetical protein
MADQQRTRLELAADTIVRAMTDPGSHPDYHYRQMTRLKTEWPALYAAIAELMAARGWSWPPELQRKLDTSL